MRAIIGNKRIKPVIGVQQVSSDKWWHHPEWVDVSDVANNEINLLVGDFGIAAVAFVVNVASSETYYVDWGDGTQNSYSSGAKAEHKYTKGSGKPCSLGYSTYKVRIWASNTITSFAAAAPTSYFPYASVMGMPILEACFGTTGLTSLSGAFSYIRNIIAIILPDILPSCSNYTNLCNGCYNLAYIKFPTTSYANLSIATTLYNASNLRELKFNNFTVSSHTSAFYNLISCISFDFTGCTFTFTSAASMFYMSSNAYEITLPNMLSVTDANSMFANSSVCKINNLENLGSRTTDVNFTNFSSRPTNGYPVPQNKEYHIYARISRIDIKGVDANNKNGAEVVRLYNAASSGFGGTSPQIDVSYTKMSASALNDLFGDLPVMSGKTIKITGALGAGSCNTSIATSKGWTVIN